MKISVIMLTYNREKLVGRMIDCIRAQTLTDFEFIIVDNGSTDNSGKIARGYLEKDSRIQVLRREKGNIGSGRNAGLDVARGDFVAFVDDDDYCDEDYLQFLYTLATENGADISICGATWADRDEKYCMGPEEALIMLLQRKNFNVAFPTKLFKREIFDGHRFLDTGAYDDIYLMPKVIAAANRIVYHGLSKYHFDRHENNNSAWTQNHKLINVEILREYLDVYEERTEWLIRQFPGSAAQWRYFNWSFMLSMVEKVTRLELADCYAIKARLVEELVANRQEILTCGYLTDFEEEWMERYIQA
ncbi:glycosyltransferase [Clostridia bacterium OttesenSCG-928-O13]|nr:glycosyltransferase [Clostridia bacterium OttesenSCG-928-O13]